MSLTRKALGAVAVGLALFLTGGLGAFADPVVGGDTPTVPTTTVSNLDVTPDGDLIARPVQLPPAAPLAVVEAKAFTRSLYVRRETKRLQRRIKQTLNDAAKWALVRGAYIRVGDSRRLAVSGLPALRQQLREAVRQKNHQQRISQHPPHLKDWLCIHHYEGSWTDTGGLYYGGIQFGYSEWLRFGYPYTHKLYAYQATPLQQIWAGVRYWRISGFWPWPNTARECGLL